MSEETNSSATEETDQSGSESTESNDEELRPEGVKALNEWKSRAKTAETERKALADRIAELENANKSERDKAIDEAREQARQEAISSLTPQLVASTIKVQAIGKVNPDFADLVADSLVGRSSEFLDDQGNPDTNAINKAIDELVKNKPALGRPQGSGDGGPRGVGGPSSGGMNQLVRQKAGF